MSNYEVKHLEEIPNFSTVVPAANQLEYHPHFRRQDIKDYCAKHGIFFQAFSSLGRYKPELIADPVVVKIAQNHKTTVEETLLAFATSQGVGIVPKSTNPERIAKNFNAFNVKLNQNEIDELNSINVDSHYIRCTGWLVV